MQPGYTGFTAMDLNLEQKSRLDAAFDRAGLSPSDREFWLGRLPTIPSDMQNRIIGMLETFPEEIAWLRDIQLRKESALASRDRGAWHAIVTEERDHLSTLVGRSQ